MELYYKRKYIKNISSISELDPILGLLIDSFNFYIQRSDILTEKSIIRRIWDILIVVNKPIEFRAIDKACKHWYVGNYGKAFYASEIHANRCKSGVTTITDANYKDANNNAFLYAHSYDFYNYLGYGFWYSEIAESLSDYPIEMIKSLISTLPNISLDDESLKNEVKEITNK